MVVVTWSKFKKRVFRITLPFLRFFGSIFFDEKYLKGKFLITILSVGNGPGEVFYGKKFLDLIEMSLGRFIHLL
jgi:hypothetical protein